LITRIKAARPGRGIDSAWAMARQAQAMPPPTAPQIAPAAGEDHDAERGDRRDEQVGFDLDVCLIDGRARPAEEGGDGVGELARVDGEFPRA